MIVKILTRKDGNFRQIIDYLYHDEGISMDYSYLHNIDVNPDNRKAIVEAFQNNDQFRKKRANGIRFYHEILSFSPEDTAVILANPDLLRDITQQYLNLRAPDGLAVARPHVEKKDHVHIHLVVSGNEKGSEKTQRLSKTKLNQIKTIIRQYQQEHFPQLQHSYQAEKIYDVPNRQTHPTWQMEERGKIQDKKQQLKQLVLNALQEADSWTTLSRLLKAKDIAIYHRRGKIAGIFWQQKKYRFSTLIREEQDLEKIASFDKMVLQETENQLWQQLRRRGKNFGLPELPKNWAGIKKDLEKMEAKEKQQMSQNKQDLNLEKEFDSL